VDGLEEHEARGVADDERAEEGEVVENGHALEARGVRAPQEYRGDEGDDHAAQPHEGHVLAPPPRREEIEEHEEEARHREDGGGTDDAQADDGNRDDVHHGVTGGLIAARRELRWPPPWSGPG